MYAVIFRAVINHIDQEYTDTASRMRELARTKYGCIEFISLMEGNREITISYWSTQEQIQAWKQDPEHLSAQETGHKKWYASYKVQIARVEREYDSH